MGKPVIWTVREDHKDELHFDTRQFPHLVWKDSADLAAQLEHFIAGAIGRLASSSAKRFATVASDQKDYVS